MTISTKSDSYNRKHEVPPAYTIPDKETQQSIYRTDKEITENLRDNLENVRRQTETLNEENIYGNNGNILYPTWDQVVYTTRDQVLYPTQGQRVSALDVRFNQTDPHDALYEIKISPAPEYSEGVNSEHATGILTNPDHENVYIYEHLNG